MKTLITGGAGFIGGHLAEALIKCGHDVVVLDNFSRGTLDNLASVRDKVSVIDADVRAPEILQRSFEGAEIVFHLAAQSNVMGSMQDPDYAVSTNVDGTHNVLRAAGDCDARRVIFASSREVYGDPLKLPVCEEVALTPKNPYGASKAAGEAYCSAWQSSYGLECQVLRFSNVFGPRDRLRVIPLWIEQAARGLPLRVYGGEQVIDFVWIDLAVEALLSAIDCPPAGPVNVGSGHGIRLLDLADRIAELSLQKVTVERLPARSAEVVRFIADTERMHSILGIVPEADPLHHLSEMFSRSCASTLSS